MGTRFSGGGGRGGGPTRVVLSFCGTYVDPKLPPTPVPPCLRVTRGPWSRDLRLLFGCQDSPCDRDSRLSLYRLKCGLKDHVLVRGPPLNLRTPLKGRTPLPRSGFACVRGTCQRIFRRPRCLIRGTLGQSFWTRCRCCYVKTFP